MASTQWVRLVRAASTGLLAASLLVACGGGDGPPPPSIGQATISSAGGTVDGPDGVQLSVPDGAFAEDTTVRIARDGSGAPEAGGLRLITPVYQVTPHGAQFDVPVRVVIPFDPAQLRSGTAPVIVRAQPGSSSWEVLKTDVAGGQAAADSFGFSYYAVGECFVSRDVSVVGPDPIASCPSGHSLSLKLLDGSGAPVPQPRNASGNLLPAMTIEAPTSVGVQLSWSRPIGTTRTDTLTLRVTGGVPDTLVKTILATDDVTSYLIPAATIDPAEIPGASAPGGKLVRIWAAVSYEFDAYYPGCVCFRRAAWTYTADLLVRVVYRGSQPSIAQQPANQSVIEGQTALFNVGVSAFSPTYQWQRSEPGSATFADLPGATTGLYQTPATTLADDGASFRVRVCSSGGVPVVTACAVSDAAMLTVGPAPIAPVFTLQPQPVAIVTGQTASFTAVATATPTPTIRWYREAVGGVSAGPATEVGTPCTGSGASTSCNLTTTPLTLADSGARFFAIATNGIDNTMSALATVTVTSGELAPTVPSDAPADVTVSAGQPATFSVVAGGTAPLSYQWSRDGTAIPGANGASYTLANAQLADSGARFAVAVSNGAGSVTSRAATLTVTSPAAPAGACTGATGSGWCWSWPLPQGNLLLALVFDGPTTLAFGDGATRMVSGDGGASWQTSFGGWTSRDSIRDVSAPSAGALVAAAGNGLFRSSDAGQSWTQVLDTAPIGYAVQSLAFRDASNGVAVGSGLWYTGDGGATWSQTSNAPGDPFLSRVAISGGAYVAVGTAGTVLRSTDQGASWSSVASGLVADLMDLAFDGAGHGVTLSAGTAYAVTTDGGLSWTVADFGAAVPGLPQSVAFTGPGQAVVLFSSGWVLRSSDGGATWSETAAEPAWPTAVSYGALRLRFKDASLGLAFGDFGVVVRTTDGGATWTQITGGGYYDGLDAVRFSAGGVGLAAGPGPAVRRSVDGGATWSSFPIVDPGNPGGDLRYVGDLAFAGTTAFAAAGQGRVYRSDDGGQNWTTAYLEGGTGDFTFAAIDFADSATGVVAGWNRSNQGVMRRTNDGGQTWSPVSIPSCPGQRALRFGSPTLGLSAGGSTLLRTTDGGQTWTVVPVGSLNNASEGINGITFVSPTVAFVATDLGLHRSTDGGLSWTRVAGGVANPVPLEAVAFGDASHGVAVGQRVLYTSDGGATWTVLDRDRGVGTVLHAVAFAASQAVVAVGDGGAILRNTGGGTP
jgi:photosystem II stability/assembly factor-like uncharacterized protein